MKRRVAALLITGAAAFGAAVSQVDAQAAPGVSAPPTAGVVASVYDGDTLTLRDGTRVRLLQIDTPETGTGECYSRAARKTLLDLAPIGSRLRLEVDPSLDRVDRYGRGLRYIHRSSNINVELVRRGAAAPYFYRGARGRYAAALMAAARQAQAAKRGLWGACPTTVLDPTKAIETGQSGAVRQPPPKAGNCDTSYPTVCMPPPPPDLDCADIPHRNFRVLSPDPHRFDGNHDGYGCEN